MKKIFLIMLTFIALYNIPASANTTHHINEIGISVSIPSEYSVITRQINDDNPILKKTGLAKEDMVSLLESDHIYLFATPDSGESEIYITMEPTGEVVPDFSKINTDDLEQLYGHIKDNLSKSGNTICEYSFYDNSGTKFIKQKINNAENSFFIQHITIYNSNAILATLKSTTGQISDEQEAVIDEIAKSIKFPEIQKSDTPTEDEPEKVGFIDNLATAVPLLTVVLIFVLPAIYYERKKKPRK